jgi:hypothetical protein
MIDDFDTNVFKKLPFKKRFWIQPQTESTAGRVFTYCVLLFFYITSYQHQDDATNYSLSKAWEIHKWHRFEIDLLIGIEIDDRDRNR